MLSKRERIKRWQVAGPILLGFVALTAYVAYLSGWCHDSGGVRPAEIQEAPHESLPSNGIEFSVGFLNAHLLPDSISAIGGNRPDAAYRASQIGRRLAPIEIIGIAEAFSSASNGQFLSAAQEATDGGFFRIGPIQSPPGRLFGNGCVLLSRFPIIQGNILEYSTGSTFWSEGFFADGFAAKGAIHACLQVSDESQIDVFVTHLESRDAQLREQQIVELADFIASMARAENHVILMGDFNIPASDALAYQYLKSTLTNRTDRLVRDLDGDPSDQGQGTSRPLLENGGSRIDYIFYLPANRADSELIPSEESTVLRLIDERVGSLSDHSAIQANFTERNNDVR